MEAIPYAWDDSGEPGSGSGEPGSLSGTPTAADEHLDRGYADFFLLLMEELVTQETSGRAGKGLLGVLHPHKVLAPGGGVGRDEATKGRLQVLIVSF